MHKLLTLTALVLASAIAQAAPPPVAEVRNVTTTLHGTTIADPYRWLENKKRPEVQAWLRGQGEAARSVLDRIDGRDTLAARWAELVDAQGDNVRGVKQMPGDRFYYLKRSPGQKQFRLVMREGLTGPEKVLVDPEDAARRTGVPHAVNYYHPSWDGRYLAYGMSAGGSEDASLYILDIATGKLLGRPYPRVYDTPIHWLPDSRRFTFNQLRALPKGAAEAETYKDSSVMLAAPGGKAKPLFGPTVTRKLGLDRLDVAEVITVPGSSWMVARTTDTTVPEGKLFVAPLASIGQPGTAWKRFAGPEHKVVHVALQGDTLAVLTQAGASRRKIVGVDLRQADLSKAALLVAEPKDAVIEGFELTPSGLVAEVRLGTQVVLKRFEKGDTAGRTLPAPAAGTAALAAAPAHDTEALVYGFTGWTEPGRMYSLDGDRSVEASFGRRAVPPDLPEVLVTDVMLPSHDGVMGADDHPAQEGLGTGRQQPRVAARLCVLRILRVSALLDQ